MAGLLPVDEVIETLLDKAVPITETEIVPLREASGRILAGAITAAVNVPPHDNSAMDGYVFDATDPDIVVGGIYTVSDRIPAGQVGQALVPGTLARIFTGAPIPPGANAVVIQEDTIGHGDRIEITERPSVGANVRPKGQDIARGSELLTRGKVLLPQDLGLLASTGIDKVEVFRKLKIAIMSTGDELVEAPGLPGPGQIYNSNHFTLAAMIEAMGMEVVDLGLVADSQEATVEALLKGAETSDCVVSSGGVSVGEEDHVKAAVEALGSLDLWKVAIKPDKPLAFGTIQNKRPVSKKDPQKLHNETTQTLQTKQVPFFGLPGNPVSSFVTFTVIAKPYLLKYQGCSETSNLSYEAMSRFAFKAGGRREYVRVKVSNDVSSGGAIVDLFDGQGSGVMSSVSWANALAEIEANAVVVPGDRVKIHPLR